MTNPLSGIITPAFKTLYDNAIDALLEDTALTVPCEIRFANTNNTECSNCHFDPLNRRSANRYRTGGPVAFVTGTTCPTCNGLGLISTRSSTTFNMAVLWNPARSKFIDLGVKFDESKVYAQSICAAHHYTSLERSESAILDTGFAGYGNQLYQRDGDPTPYKLGHKTYIVTMWSRVK